MKREKVEKIRKRKAIILTLTILGLLFVITGVSYSMFYADLKGIREHTINSNTLIFEYEEPTNELMLEGNQGKTDEEGKEQEENFEFTVTGKSNGEQEILYDVYIEKLEVENEIPEEKIKYYLTKVEEEEIKVGGAELLSEVVGTDKKVIYTTTMELNNNEVEHRYRLRLWLDETYEITDLVETKENSNGEQTAILKEHKYKYRVNILIREPSNLANNWQDYTEYEDDYLAMYTQGKLELPETKEYNGVTYTKESEVDVSEQQNGKVLLGTYVNGSDRIAILAQEGKVIAPENSYMLFAFVVGIMPIKVGDLTNDANNNYEYMDLSYLDTSNVINMGDMFIRCSNLTDLDVSSFNTSNVTNMGYMFYGCSSLTDLDVSSFNTSNVVNMDHMFYGCISLTSLDLSNFDTGKVTNTDAMFYNASSITEIKVGCNWTTENATTTSMFYNSGVSAVTQICNN